MPMGEEKNTKQNRRPVATMTSQAGRPASDNL